MKTSLKLKAFVLPIIVFFFIFQSASTKGYKIKVQVDGLSDTTVLLGHHFNKSLLPDDTVYVDKNGVGVLEGDQPLVGGLYILLFPNQKWFDFLVDVDQEFTIFCDTNANLSNVRYEGSSLNENFLAFQSKVSELKTKSTEWRIRSDAEKDEAKKAKYQSEIEKVSADYKILTNKTIEENADNFMGVFLKATQDVVVPDPPKDENGQVLDSLFRYKYYKAHYFDNFDLSDPRLLRTPFYEDKMKNYLEKMVAQVPDSLNKEVDMFVEESRTSPELFRFVLTTLLNHYAKSKVMGLDAVYLHIAEKYYIDEAEWSSPKFIADLKENVSKQKHLVLGKKAPNIQLRYVPSSHFKSAEFDTAARSDVHVGEFVNLHDIKADYIVVYFWEQSCGHCRKASPGVHKMAQRLKDKNVKVLAVHMMGGYDGKKKWVDWVNKHDMYDWMNAWNPYSYDYKLQFNLKSANQIYVLDKNHEIIAKRVGAEQAEEIILDYINDDKNK